MMVLRRKVGQAIRIGDDVRIVIQDVKHGREVRIAIDAPSSVAVHRLEIYKIIQQENQASSNQHALMWLQGSQGYGTSDDAA